VDRRRLTRWLFGLLPALALAALFAFVLLLAGDAEADAARLGRWWLWAFGGAAASVALVLGAIIGRAWDLVRARRERRPGARLAARWAIALVLLAVPPLLLVYGFALRFLHTTVDSWLNVQVAAGLDDALALGRLWLDGEVARARAEGEALAGRLAGAPDLQAALESELDASDALQFAVFTASGSLRAAAAADPRLLLPTPPDPTELLRVRDGAVEADSQPLGEDLVVRTLRALPPDDVLLAVWPLPSDVRPLVRNIEATWADWQRLSFLRDSLKLTFTLVLTLALLLSLLLAVLAALRVARRQVAPVARLAVATAEIARGEYGREVPAGGDDELGFLTESFNRMSRELAAASSAARESQAQTERQRAYLETVLARLSSGVLTWGTDGRLRTANAAASRILGLDLAPFIGGPLAALAGAEPALVPLVEALAARAAEGVGEWREELRLPREAAGEAAQILVLRGAALPAGEHGFVAVFDDETVLNQAQREAAWSEVARRLAHEVKNPLTPIQLSAERLKLRLGGKLDAADAQVLDKATGTIVAQVEALKTLVNAFGDYARPPQLKLERLRLNELAGAVLDLYEQDPNLRIVRRLDPADPWIRADAGRLRQLLHNLVKNAIEASAAAPEIELATECVDGGDRPEVALRVADRGTGLPPGFDDSWFEPYRSGKPRGSGLGLAVVRKVADEHGARVAATDREGGGAVFTVWFPRD
jgi:nitrogen fixation/metabolism regulation signal transduction histidine kinase